MIRSNSVQSNLSDAIPEFHSWYSIMETRPYVHVMQVTGDQMNN